MKHAEVSRMLYDIKSLDDLKKILQLMKAEDVLAPSSATESSLAAKAAGHMSCFSYNEADHAKAVSLILDKIEEATDNNEARLNTILSENHFGRTAFHETLQFTNLDCFKVLEERLRKWAGDERADQWLTAFLEQPLGNIDRDASFALQDVREIRPWKSEEADWIDSLCCQRYAPATVGALNARLDKIRPMILEWMEQNPGKKPNLKTLAQDPNAVVADETPLSTAFGSRMFMHLLGIRQKANPQTPAQQADDIFGMLSQQNVEGQTPMHRYWQHSVMMGPPGGVGQVEDSLAPVIAGFDKLLGQDAGLDLVKKLLLLQNKEDKLPLDSFQYNDMPRRDYYIKAFLGNLREELGTKEKFTLYVKEVIAAVLPLDFTIKLAAYEPEPVSSTGAPVPRRGAKIE